MFSYLLEKRMNDYFFNVSLDNNECLIAHDNNNKKYNNLNRYQTVIQFLTEQFCLTEQVPTFINGAEIYSAISNSVKNGIPDKSFVAAVTQENSLEKKEKKVILKKLQNFTERWYTFLSKNQVKEDTPHTTTNL